MNGCTENSADCLSRVILTTHFAKFRNEQEACERILFLCVGDDTYVSAYAVTIRIVYVLCYDDICMYYVGIASACVTFS